MISFAFIFLCAITIVIASFALSTFLVGISRYLRDDPHYISVDKWGQYTAKMSVDSPLVHCPEYRPGPSEFEYAHVSGPWHG